MKENERKQKKKKTIVKINSAALEEYLRELSEGYCKKEIGRKKKTQHFGRQARFLHHVLIPASSVIAKVHRKKKKREEKIIVGIYIYIKENKKKGKRI